jgi:ribonuclease G
LDASARHRRALALFGDSRLYKEIIVNADVRETRIAVREDGQLVELHIEREERVVGSIYKARVENVLPGMDAAFVDIGLDRNAFLYAGDIVGDMGDADESGSDGAAGGNFNRHGRRQRAHANIRDLVKRGQEILVQVVKGPRGTKGSRVSSRISLPGRYLVFMPDENSTGVSRKIDDGKERDRLKKIVEGVRRPGYGLIVRTEAEGKTERELKQDLAFLEKQWADIREKARVTPAPNLVYADLTLLFRILRDAFGQDVDKLVLDNASDYKRAHELLDFFGPALKDRVELYDGDKPVFEHHGIEQEIERLLKRRVWLKSGGYLVIDQAEALVAIDVNSGRNTGGGAGNLNETILQTNLEAAAEIARQLRLRDLGGILVLDFIDMNSAADRKKVEQAFERELKKDKSRCKPSALSPLGLMEMTRKRTGETINEQMDEPCPTVPAMAAFLQPSRSASRSCAICAAFRARKASMRHSWCRATRRSPRISWAMPAKTSSGWNINWRAACTCASAKICTRKSTRSPAAAWTSSTGRACRIARARWWTFRSFATPLPPRRTPPATPRAGIWSRSPGRQAHRPGRSRPPCSRRPLHRRGRTRWPEQWRRRRPEPAPQPPPAASNPSTRPGQP